MNLKILALFSLILGTIHAEDRSWTSIDGKIIRGELKELSNEQVTLHVNGRDFHVPLSKLSLADQEFAKNWTKPSASALQLGPTQIHPDGKRYTVNVPITAENAPVLFKKLKNDPKFVVINIAIPANFSASTSPKCLWIAAPINSDQQAKDGNQSAFASYQSTGLSAGYVVLSMDSPQGNPRGFTPSYDREYADAVVEILSKIWPNFREWQHACAGFSGGSKVSFFRVAQLCANKVHVIGCFFAGCNQVGSSAATEESRPRKAELKLVSGWVSNGTGDGIANPSQGESVVSSLDSFGYGKAKLVTFPGGHELNTSELKKALEWFESEAKTAKK